MKAKKSIRAIISIFLVLITLLSTFIPAVAAAENGIVEDFKVEFISGADNVDGKYVFDATKDNSGLRWNRFIYRVNYALSGEGMLQPGKVKITLPTSIITDRDGNIADEFDIAVPHADDVEETDNEVKFVYTVENDNTIVITNRLEISSAQAGNIEIAYIPTKSEINYVDMKKSADVTSTFTLGEGGAGYTRTSSADGVYFDTSVNNNYSSMACKNTTGGANDWNSSWGLEEPENSEQYTYVIWEIHTYLNNMTQYYDFEINDTMLPTDGEVLGYKFQNQTKYTTSNRVEKQNISQRYDYVLTKHLKTDVQQHGRVVPNYAETVVIPYDGVDEQTTANTSANFVYYISRNFDFNGQITSNKQGLNNESYVYDSNNISDFRLSEFKNGEINKIDNLTYECKFGEDGWNWDIDFDENGIKKSSGYYTTYTLEDKEIRVGSNVNEFVVGPQTATLQKESYDFNSLRITSFCNDIGFNNETKKIEPDSSKPINDIDYDVLVSVDGFDNYVKAATYHNKTKTWSDVDESIVTGTDNNGNIFFKDGVDAWEVTTTTNVFYLRYYVRSSITLNRTEEVLNYIGDSKLIPVNNRANYFVSYNEQDTDKKQMKTVDKHANVYVADPSILKKSSLSINAVKTLNNRIKRQYEASWNVKMLEYIDGVDSINQESGKFYILLPLGATLEKDSVAVKDGYGRIIPPGSFRYTVTPNYNNSGRILLTVDINKEGVNYTVDYKTLHSWSNLKDYGSMTYTSAAYETGNDNITNGYPDNGDSLIDNNYMADLDSETNDEKFIYTSRYYNVIAVTASSVGLTKLVQGSDDEKFSQSTNVHQNEVYTYQIRIANDYRTKSKDIILFDSIENFTKEGLQSDWRGTLQSVDITNLTEKDVAAVVYYSEIANLDISQHYDLTEQISGKKVWQTAEEIGDISNAKAIAIDCRKTVNGENFVLDKSQSIVVPVYLKSPAQVSETIENPETYNNIYLNETLIVEDGIETNDLVHYDYTAVGYRTVGNIEIRKVDSTDHEKLIEGVSFNLVGKSAYGTEYNLTSTTDSNGYICFNNIEKGEYTLTETEGVIDYLEDHNSIAVTIDNKGNVTVEGKEKEGNVYVIENKPRIHGDLTFTKVDKISYETGDKKLEGAEFRLSGKSDYGNDILMYATSNAEGQVNFYNIELGTYTLVETKYPDNYRNDGKKYTVVCDNSGILSIDVPLNSKGKYEIENEPYEEIKVYKVDADNPSLYLEGVQLRIHGTSDYGTEYDKTVTTNSNGVAAFGEMEIGKYILEEVQALENYKLDENKYVVTISANHTVTIEGLKKNNLGFWVFPNQRELNGKIKVTKVWKDNADNETRETPKVHIGLKEPERAVPTATFKPYFGYSYLRSAKTFSRDTSKSLSEVQDITGVIKVDDETTDKSIYIWIDTDNNGYWWSDAEIVYLPENSKNLFSNCSNLTSLDLSSFDTSRVTDMSRMFFYCSNLTSLDVSGFDTSRVTDMSYMFYYCSNLTSLDVSGFDTSRVTDMSYMFYSCSNLTSLDVSGFDTSRVANMSSMFSSCSNLTLLDVSGFDTSRVANMSSMFSSCSNLTLLDVSGFDTSRVANMSSMFYSCSNLTSLDVSGFDTSRVANMSNMFSYCSNLTSLDVSGFDTSRVTDMSDMFSYCSNLTLLDVSGFDTSRVANMSSMFNNCSNLTSLDVSGFDTSRVTDMSYMFNHCSKLTSLDVSGFDTSRVTDMSSMFSSCSNLTSLDLSSFDTSMVTNMSSMFSSCSNLTSLDLSSFDTSSVTNMCYMFYICSNLTSLDLSSFDTSSVTDMSNMFSSCSNLTSLDVSGFDTSRVTDMSSMFYICSNLTSLDLSSFDTSRVTNMSRMFYYCRSIITIYASDLFDTSSVSTSFSMFTNCTSLKGGNGTLYNGQKVNKEYAHIDTAETPGYFTYKKSSIEKILTTIDINKHSNALNNINKTNIISYAQNKTKSLEEVQAITGVFKIDDETTDKSVYIWAENDGKNVYWWSDAEIVYLPKNSNIMFNGCRSLTSLDVSGFDTSRVANMSSMFSNCSNLTSLDLSSFDTSRVANMSYMFSNCSNLTSLDLSSFDTSRVANMSNMFSYCSNLTSLDVSGFDTSRVTNMFYMFYSCSNLTSLDLSSFDTSSVTNMSYMFYSCSNLTSLDVSGFDTSSVTNMGGMFYYCRSIITIYTSDLFDTNNVISSNEMFSGCKKLVGGNGTLYNGQKTDKKYACIDTPETPGYFTYKEYSPSTPTEPSEPTEPVVKPPISAEYATLSKALFTETVELATSPRYWQKAYIQNFIHNTDKTLEEVEAIAGAVKVDNGATDKAIYIWADNYSNNTMKTVYWWSNASKVYLPANSSYLFTDFSALKNVDLADFDTSKVTVADSMFKGCKQIQTVGIGNWNTKKLTSAADMFANCYALTEPNVSNWKTPRLTNISGMFSGCGALSSLDLNGWNTKKLENINSTFSNCTKLSNLGIGNWNTQSLTDMGSAFGNCSKLNPINIGSWDVSKVTNLRETFNYCRAITSLDVSDWNTSSVTDMQGTFKGASSLTSLDLSGWDTSSVTNMREMFSGDTSLTTVYVSDLFNTDAVTDFNGMFYNAKNIVGGKGTTYDSSKINGEYANIDRTDDAGYLTLKDVLSRTYDSDDNGWTIVDDNTWTYTFDVFDDTAQYYIYEEDMEGYKSDTSFEAKKRLNDGDITNVITITNTADDVPDEPDEPKITDFGSLTVTKTVHGDGLAVGEQGYIIGDFTFKLTLSGNDDITSGTKVWGDRVYENGVTTFKLHDRQSASFTGIPAGLNYTVTELNTEGYTVLTENSSGTITKDVNTTVSFVNNWQGDSRNKNSFSLVKRVINGEDNDVFNFTVFLTNLYPKLAYKLSDNTVYYSDSDGEATVNVQLKADDVITFQNLPVGSTYQITEKATPYYASYSVADELNLKMITSSSGSNTEVNKALSTGKENVEDNEKITVTFTNEKIITPVEPDPPAVKSVSVIKNWVNDNPTERPDSITVYLYQNEDLLKSAEITSTDNWRTTFDNLLVYDDFGKEYEYSVIEADVRGYVTDYTTSGNTYTITNTKVPVGNIEISNEIRGNAADFTKEFKYTVTLTDANGEPVTSSFERIGTKAGDMPFVNGVSTIYLTHHDDITIKDIPAGYHFKIVQTEDSLYTVTPDTATYEGVIIANDTIRNPYINELNAYGTLMVRKELESTRTEDRNLEFDFTVSIVKGNEKLSGTYECEGTSLSSITFNDGSANFKLKGGQTISIKDLPVGADYEVEEVGANSLDFLTYADNQKGVISKNSEENLVRFKNVRNVLPETGSYGNILLIGGSAFFLLLGFTVLLLRKREKNETK